MAKRNPSALDRVYAAAPPPSNDGAGPDRAKRVGSLIRAAVVEHARAPHRAVRETVEAAGHPMIAALYLAFDEFNRDHFAGQLLPPMILVTQTSSPRALGDACEQDPHGLRSIVRLAPKTLARGELFASDILLHEMIHVWQYEIARDSEPGYKGHGVLFTRECNRIGRALGLGDVGVKGRKGLPNSAQWPLCVRPPGFYGNDDAEHEREKRAPKPEADKGGHDPEDQADARAEVSRAGAAAVCELAADESEESDEPPAIAKTLRAAAAYLRNAGE